VPLPLRSAGARTRTASLRHATPDDVADSKGFLGALFDFGFQSFVTPKIVKMLYVLIMIGTVVSALVFTIAAFKASLTFGVATLLFGDPLFILIVLAIYRIILEFFVVAFRISEDMRALRERGSIG
jgi:predicted neutral ceramidase superfamily lipid hydrolase